MCPHPLPLHLPKPAGTVPLSSYLVFELVSAVTPTQPGCHTLPSTPQTHPPGSQTEGSRDKCTVTCSPSIPSGFWMLVATCQTELAPMNNFLKT